MEQEIHHVSTKSNSTSQPVSIMGIASASKGKANPAVEEDLKEISTWFYM
jgi:hypothetical protein